MQSNGAVCTRRGGCCSCGRRRPRLARGGVVDKLASPSPQQQQQHGWCGPVEHALAATPSADRVPRTLCNRGTRGRRRRGRRRSHSCDLMMKPTSATISRRRLRANWRGGGWWRAIADAARRRHVGAPTENSALCTTWSSGGEVVEDKAGTVLIAAKIVGLSAPGAPTAPRSSTCRATARQTSRLASIRSLPNSTQNGTMMADAVVRREGCPKMEHNDKI